MTSWRSSADAAADAIIRPLTPDHGWDSYIDLTMRAFGPSDEAGLRATIEPAMARPEPKVPKDAKDAKTAGIRRPGPDDAAEVIEVIGRAHAGARDCGPTTWDETRFLRGGPRRTAADHR